MALCSAIIFCVQNILIVWLLNVFFGEGSYASCWNMLYMGTLYNFISLCMGVCIWVREWHWIWKCLGLVAGFFILLPMFGEFALVICLLALLYAAEMFLVKRWWDGLDRDEGK